MGEDDHAGLQREIYEELRRRAARLMRAQPRNHTLQATALVHEVYLKVRGLEEPNQEERDHFLAIASRAMRQVLQDHARARMRTKRRASGQRVALDQIDQVVTRYEDHAFDLVALDHALQRLAEFDPDMAQAVELRFFGGLTVDETARILGLSTRTFERRWKATRAWLYAEVA